MPYTISKTPDLISGCPFWVRNLRNFSFISPLFFSFSFFLFPLITDRVHFLGESFGDIPPCFLEAQKKLAGQIDHWGYAASKEEYFHVLRSSDIVVSTARHEFFGVSVIEAIASGCYPLCPNALVFPEYLGDAHLYNTFDQLVKKLRYYCRYPNKLRSFERKPHVDLSAFDWAQLKSSFFDVLAPPQSS
jgi:glycosyltransferase involved in cell wall biosynthesis